MEQKEKTVIPICLAADKNYLQPLAVTMASILKNKAASDDIRFYILENTFSDSDRQLLSQLKSIADFEIEYINVQDKVLNLFPLKKKDRVSIETYFRLLIPELIPHEDRIIYLDCDIIVQNSLAKLYSIDPGEGYIMGVRDIDSRRHAKRLHTPRYINAGVLLMNSKKMREGRIIEKFIDYITVHQNNIEMHDQDVIAAVLKDHIRYIPDTWNGQVARLPVRQELSRLHHAAVLHYISHRKPWLPNKRSIMASIYFNYLRLTPFSDAEKTYRFRRFFWHISKIPSNLLKFVYSKRNSRHGTYQTIQILGIIKFKRKRKSPLLDLTEDW